MLSKERENKIVGDKLRLTTNIHVNKPNADPGQELPQAPGFEDVICPELPELGLSLRLKCPTKSRHGCCRSL